MRKNPAAQSPPPARRRLLLGAAAGAILILVVLLLAKRGKHAPSEEALLEAAPTKPTTTTKASPTKQGEAKPFGLRENALGDEEPVSRDIAEKRLARARQTLESYRQSTRYPPTSRPLSEKPDLQKPHSVASSTQPLGRGEKPPTKARVTLSQDRLYLVGDEVAQFKMECATPEGGPAPCEIQSAFARVPESMVNAPRITPAPVAFMDAPNGPSTKIATFAPANAGFGGYHGPITIALVAQIGDEEGNASFDLVYTPAAPARFTGKVREEMDDGSLCLYVQMAVDKPGRYVLHARVDDSSGEGFAFLEFNEILGANLQDAKMCIFGKLVLDEQAKAPFVLRDVEGFLLKEDTYPDRELVPAREGPVFTTKAWPEAAFSDAEWQSEERTRHLNEFGKDVKEAEEALESAGSP